MKGIPNSWAHHYLARAAIFSIVMSLIGGALGCNEYSTIDHFKCYAARPETAPYAGQNVTLEDQFGTVNATLSANATVEEWPWAVFFCNPVEKIHNGVTTPILDSDHYLTIYSLNCTEEPQIWEVRVQNQFGTQYLTVWGPVALAVPTQELAPGNHKPPVDLDHFLLYCVIEGPSLNVTVDMKDQFREDTDVPVYWPVAFANPVRETHNSGVTEIQNPGAHLVFYGISAESWEGPEVQVVNQFGEQAFDLSQDPAIFALPSRKLYYDPIS